MRYFFESRVYGNSGGGLLHGFLGFSRWGPIEQFRGVEKALGRKDIRPLIPEVPGAGTIAERAEILANKLFRRRAPVFALVAHSMGGLDARYSSATSTRSGA